MPLDLPDSPDDLTPGFLNATLELELNDVTVASCAVERIGEGKGFTGRVFRMRLGYRDQGVTGPSTLIAKMPAEDREFRSNTWSMYESEFWFYSQMADSVRLRSPTCHLNSLDSNSTTSLLLLEDLGHLRSGDQVAGCEVADVESGLASLAAMHAGHWGRPEPVAIDVRDQQRRARRRRLFPEWWQAFLDLYGDLIPPSAEEAGKLLVTKPDELSGRLLECPRTFVHGDFRLDNLFFRRTAASLPLIGRSAAPAARCGTPAGSSSAASLRPRRLAALRPCSRPIAQPS